jgi:hypothetical protein
MRWLLVTAGVVPRSPILVTLMEEALSTYDASVLTRAAWLNIPEDTILDRRYVFIPVQWVLWDCFAVRTAAEAWN